MTLSELSKQLHLPVEWFRTVFQIESKNNPGAVNPISGARGLIQFMPALLKSWGVSQLPTDYNSQLDYVYKYFKPYLGKMLKPGFSLTDLYLLVFYPYAVGKGMDYVIGSEKGMKYAQEVARENPAFLVHYQPGDVITKRDVARIVKSARKQIGYTDFQYFKHRIFRPSFPL